MALACSDIRDILSWWHCDTTEPYASKAGENAPQVQMWVVSVALCVRSGGKEASGGQGQQQKGTLIGGVLYQKLTCHTVMVERWDALSCYIPPVTSVPVNIPARDWRVTQ